MRNFSKIMIGITAVALLATLSVTPSLAVTQTYQGAVRDLPTVEGFAGLCTISRTWSAADSTKFNANICTASGTCAQPAANNFCRRTFAANISATGTGGYNTSQDDITLYNGGTDAQTTFGLLEQCKNGGTAAAVAYYSIASQVVVEAESGNLGNDACTGATLISAFCPGSATRRAAAQPNTRLGLLSPIGGFNPIPAARISSITPTTVNLSWDAAYILNTKDATAIPFKGYNVYQFIDASGNAICEPPSDTAGWGLPIAQVLHPTTTFAAVKPTFTGPQDCVFYALQLVFNGPTTSGKDQGPNAAAGEVTTGLACGGPGGASSAGAKVNPSAVVISNFAAIYVGKNTFRVSWNSGSESGISGFYIRRSTNPNGSFTRVGNLVAAAGDGSAYNTLDKVTRKLGSTFYYQLEAVMTDGTSEIVGNTSGTLPKVSNKN